MSMDFKVKVQGLVPGAAGIALVEGTREFIVREVDHQVEAERAALRVAREAGIEGAYVVGCARWFGGEVQAPFWGGPGG